MTPLTPHLTRDRTEQYLLGALPPEASAELEAHTLTCEACARLLQQEALLEEQLYEVAAAMPRDAVVVRPARWHRPAAVAASVMVGTMWSATVPTPVIQVTVPSAIRPASLSRVGPRAATSTGGGTTVGISSGA